MNFSYLLIVVNLVFSLRLIPGKRLHWQYANETQNTNRIVGGEEAAEGSAPYQVAIRTEWDSLICGGVILNSKWVLTAGHCIKDWRIDVLRIVTGTNEWLKDGATYQPVKSIVHSMYDIPFMYHNDIGLLQVEGNIEFNEKTQPIALAFEWPQPGDVVTLTGWGTEEFNGEPAEKLRKAELTVISHEDCKKAWSNMEGVDVGHMCTFTREGQGACNGDSGGPLVFKGKLVGLVNWGAPCARGLPDVHASIPYYFDFIKLSLSRCGILRE